MIPEVIILVLLGLAISLAFYAVYMRDVAVDLKNNKDILVTCLEKSAAKSTTDGIEEVSFVEGWNAGLKAAIDLAEEISDE